jgi:Bacteriophage lambda head decoration protein D
MTSHSSIVASSAARFSRSTAEIVRATSSGDASRALNPAASDGSQTAAGVLYDAVDATTADAEGVELDGKIGAARSCDLAVLSELLPAAEAGLVAALVAIVFGMTGLD